MNAFLERLGRLLVAGLHAEAAALVQAETDPVTRLLGESALAAARGDARGALDLARRAHALAPEEPHVLQYLAFSHAGLGEHAAAEQHLEAAVARDPTTRSLGGLGNAQLAAGRLDAAQATYERLLGREPHNPVGLHGLATVARKRGDFGRALEHYAQAFTVSPDDGTITEALVSFFAEAGWALGAMALARMTRDATQSAPVRLLMDFILVQLAQQVTAQFGEAALSPDLDALLGEAAELAAGQPPALQIQIARMLCDHGRHPAARALVDGLKSAKLTPAEVASVHYVRGLLAEAEGDPDDALAHYTAAVEGDGERWDACCNAMSLLLERGDAEALARIPTLVGRVPEPLKATRPQLLFNEGVYLRRVGRTDEARARLQVVAALGRRAGGLAELARSALLEMSDG